MYRRFLWSLVGFLAAPVVVFGQTIPAFPGADGVARNVTGGRANALGGIVYHVTKLDSAIDDVDRETFGTLRYGLNSANFPANVPRTIVFDVGGVFHLGRETQVGWDPNGNGWDAQSRLTIGGSNVTLAGQTAPGAGVIFIGGGLKPQGNNNIIRNITMASGYGTRNWYEPGDPYPPPPNTPGLDPAQIFPDDVVYDGMDISGTNIMIDHVSTLFTTDESISMNERAKNITVQYSNISQGQNYPQWDAENPTLTGHALGSLLEAGDSVSQAAISFHHNLYAHQKGRVPQLQSKSGSLGAFYDFRNNVFYNWFGTAGSRSGATSLNLVNNFYLSGPGGDQPVGGTNPGIGTQTGGTSVISAGSSVYRNGNWLDSNKNSNTSDGGPLSNGGSGPFWMGGVQTYVGTTDSATQAFDRVLDYVGARWWTRDDVIDTPDERIIHEARTVSGKIIAWADDPWNSDPAEGAEWRALKDTAPVNRPADWDTEPSIGYGVGDGMPTYWELEHGLDPDARDNNGDFDNDGYTNLEEYLNDIAAWPAPNAIVFNNAQGNGRYAHILNWDANPDAAFVHPWQPSRFDTALINNGTVVVDAAGQHAGNLLLATNPGDNATLNITAGWIKVEEDTRSDLSAGTTVIGDDPGANATLNLSGGRLTTKLLLKGPGGQFNFTGGVLSAGTVGFTLENQGGTIAPGSSPGMTHVMGDLVLDSGVLEIEIGGTDPQQYDRIAVDGQTTLGGTLQVKLADLDGDGNAFVPSLDDQFAFLVTGSIDPLEVFDAVDFSLAPLPEGLEWELTTGTTTFLTVVAAEVGLDGDFNNDGVVDAGDYVRWRNHLGDPDETAIFNNGDGGDVGLGDYALWKANYGNPPTEGGGGLAGVPEPASLVLLLFGVASCRWRRADRTRS